MLLDESFVYGTWTDITPGGLQSLASGASVQTALLSLGGTSGIEVETIIAGTPTATAYLDIVVERAGNNGTSVSSFENANGISTMFFSASPNRLVKTFLPDGGLDKIIIEIKNATGASLSASGNAIWYRTVLRRVTAT